MLTETNEKLTGRQLEILGLVAKGYTNPEICELLSISINTVKIHVAAILRILGVTNRTEAAYFYQEMITGDASSELASRAKTAQRVGCPAIAVVPFEERTPADDGFSIGLVEDLITRIASWRWFPVVAYASSCKFNLQTDSVEHVGKQLNVGYIITGGVRRVGSRVRINASLLSVADRETIWSENFDNDLNDVFAVQDDLSRKIVARIAPELIDFEGRADAPANVSLDAWRHAARGLWHLAKRDKSNTIKARVSLDAALAIDENYGIAWFGKAQYHYQMIFEQWSEDRASELQQFMQAVGTYARIDPNSSSSHFFRGLAKLIAGDASSAHAHLKEAIALNPSNGPALGLMGQLLGMQGAVEEGMALLEEALRLNPFDATTWMYVCCLGIGYFQLGNYDEGIAHAQRAIAIKKDALLPHALLIACLQNSGRTAAAKETVARLLAANSGYRIGPLVGLMSVATPEQVERLRSALVAAGVPE